MGRTKRKRSSRRERSVDTSDEHVVNLQKWMSKSGYNNHTELKIKCFLETGRGITSSKKITANDILISIPLELMITYNTLKSAGLVIKQKLTMHEYLALFLVLEKQKGNDSNWLEYIRSLPEQVPPLPWLATPEEVELYPTDLRIIIEKNNESFKAFLCRVEKSIPKVCVLDYGLLRWAYAMVNTRAVYVDHKIICNDSSFGLLIDEPRMALCPFLDMFNHNYLARTEASLVYEQDCLVYQLKTLTGYKKYDQIFISYGCHDNFKLLTEYGFFIVNNQYDVIRFTFEDVSKVLKFCWDQNKYKFIKEHGLRNDIYVGYDGVSFSLKAVLFVGWYVESKRLDSTIFSDNYPRRFLEEILPCYVRTLLEFKSEVFKNDLKFLKNDLITSESAKTVLDFVGYRCKFINELKKIFE